MNEDITCLMKRIKKDVINYLKVRNIDATPEMIDDIINEIVTMSGISIGEDVYFHQDIVDAVNVILKKI